jgi:hypothetical protein
MQIFKSLLIITLFLASIAVVQSSSTRRLKKKKSSKNNPLECGAELIIQIFNCLDLDGSGRVTLAEAEENRRCYQSYGEGLVDYFVCIDGGNNPTAEIEIDLDEALARGCDCVPW